METTRTNFSQLPNAKELDFMLEKESVRVPTEAKKGKHFHEFGFFTKWLQFFDYHADEFLAPTKPDEIFKWANATKAILIPKTLEHLGADSTKLVDILVTLGDYLGEEDLPAKSDFIIVFGSSDLARVEKSIELYKKGISEYLVITGGQPFYKEEKTPEAVIFARHAIKLGVPKDRIIVESNSINIADNVKTAFNLLDGLKVDYATLVSVTAWFAQRRAWSHMMKLSPDNTKVCRVNSVFSGGRLCKEEWLKNELGLGVVFNEFIKMKVAESVNDSA